MQSIEKKYDVVAANIVASVIIELSAIVPKLIKKDGVFIMSGIIAERLDEVRCALAPTPRTTTAFPSSSAIWPKRAITGTRKCSAVFAGWHTTDFSVSAIPRVFIASATAENSRPIVGRKRNATHTATDTFAGTRIACSAQASSPRRVVAIILKANIKAGRTWRYIRSDAAKGESKVFPLATSSCAVTANSAKKASQRTIAIKRRQYDITTTVSDKTPVSANRL